MFSKRSRSTGWYRDAVATTFTMVNCSVKAASSVKLSVKLFVIDVLVLIRFKAESIIISVWWP
ncbi:MAG: hypothetical protein QXG39_01560 [Candidatus Aenigmatarchaeota archaeon]